jgi:hypothetical protein
MSIIHRTTLVPSKLELLAAWLPSRSWFQAPAGDLVKAGGFRLDDPAGEVGIEFMVVRDGDAAYHVPMTYRAAPLEGHSDALIGTMEHGVLGHRWAYDAPRDPVFVAQLIALINGEAEPQAQSINETPDPTVSYSATGRRLAGPAVQVDQVRDTTQIALADGTVVEVNRVLLPGSAGHVTAGWSGPDGADGARVYGSFAAVVP